MKGTKIGLDEVSKESYIIIEDSEDQGDYSTSGEKQFMTKIDAPSGLLDPTTKPPCTNDDFLGCYQPVWCPVFRCIISKKDDNKYYRDSWIEGQTEHESEEITPLTERLGFAWGSKKEVKLMYNGSLNRFECVLSDSFRMPLVRVIPSLPSGTGAMPPEINIGIP